MAVASNSWKKKGVRRHFAERGARRRAGRDKTGLAPAHATEE